MGELPPLLTPQGPGVTWARGPRFPRVDDSGTSCSSFAIFRLSRDLPLNRRIRFWYFVSVFPSTSRYWLLHGSPRPCCPVFPSVSFPFVSSGFLHFVPHYVTQDYSLPPTHMYLFSSYLALPFVSSSLFDLFAATFAFTYAPAFPRDPFVSRFYRLGFEARFLWPASRAEAPSHHSPGAAKDTG